MTSALQQTQKTTFVERFSGDDVDGRAATWEGNVLNAAAFICGEIGQYNVFFFSTRNINVFIAGQLDR